MVEELRGWLSNRLSCGHTRGGSPIVSGAGRRTGLGAGRRMMLGSITRSFRPPTITRCSILSRRTRMTLRFPSTGSDSITATRVGATTLPWSHRLCTDSNTPVKFALRSKAQSGRAPSRPSDAKQDERLVTFRPDENNWAIDGRHPSAQLLCLARCIEVVHRWPIGVVVDGHQPQR